MAVGSVSLVVVLGELVQTAAGKWITHLPARCPNGHQLGPGQVLVGHQACLGHGGGHTTWTCRTCDETVYGGRPPRHELHQRRSFPELRHMLCSAA